MLFGNPSKFAIQADYVPEWSHQGSKYGVFSVFVNWNLMGSNSASPEDLWFQTDQLNDFFKKNPHPIELPENFREKEPLALLTLLVEFTFPTDASVPAAKNCWDYVISPNALHDKGFFLFRYAVAGQEAILGGSITSGFATVTSNPVGYVFQVIIDARKFCDA